MRVPSRPWAEIAADYREMKWGAPMAELVEHIAASPYAELIHAFTSAHTLYVGQTPVLDWQVQVLRIEPDLRGGEIARLLFEFIEHPDVERRWKRECAPEDGIATFERFLRAQRWIVELPPPA
ncbi:MAG TPA: hypothetical protein VFR81_17750 [Longimicrobium sp.]|nr:hypothetical protein [Longimicrobium sp.]